MHYVYVYDKTKRSMDIHAKFTQKYKKLGNYVKYGLLIYYTMFLRLQYVYAIPDSQGHDMSLSACHPCLLQQPFSYL